MQKPDGRNTTTTNNNNNNRVTHQQSNYYKNGGDFENGNTSKTRSMARDTRGIGMAPDPNNGQQHPGGTSRSLSFHRKKVKSDSASSNCKGKQEGNRWNTTCKENQRRRSPSVDRETNRAGLKETPGPGGDGCEKKEMKEKCEEKVYKIPAEPSGGGEIVLRQQKKGHLDIRVVYSREYMLQCAGSPFSCLPPPSMAFVALHLTEILRKIPGKFDGKVYKGFCNQIKHTVIFGYKE